jgi:hypothetical protein
MVRNSLVLPHKSLLSEAYGEVTQGEQMYVLTVESLVLSKSHHCSIIVFM